MAPPLDRSDPVDMPFVPQGFNFDAFGFGMGHPFHQDMGDFVGFDLTVLLQGAVAEFQLRL